MATYDNPRLPQWKIVSLIDDHRVYEVVREENYLARLLRDGKRPAIVGAGPVGYNGYLCLNLIREDENGELHLTQFSTWNLTPERLEELHTTGSVEIRSDDLKKVLWRFEMIPADAPESALRCPR